MNIRNAYQGHSRGAFQGHITEQKELTEGHTRGTGAHEGAPGGYRGTRGNKETKSSIVHGIILETFSSE